MSETLTPTIERALLPLGENLEPLDTPRALWANLFHTLRRPLTTAALNSLGTAAFAAGSTVAAMRVLAATTPTSERLGAAVAFFVLNIASHATVRRAGLLRAEISLATESYLIQRLSRKLIHLSADAMARQSTGTLKILITSDVKSIGTFLDSVVRNLIPALAGVLIVGPLLVHYAGTAGLVGIAAMTAIFPLALVLNERSKKLQARSQREVDGITSLLGEWVKHVRLVRSLSWQGAIRRETEIRMRSYLLLACRNHLIACCLFGLNLSWWMVSVTSVMLYAHFVGLGIDLVGFFGSLWLLTFLGSYFTHLPMTLRFYSQAVPSVARIVAVLREEEEKDSFADVGPDLTDATPICIRTRGVGLKRGERWILRDVNLALELDRKIALIGVVGSGKTTLLKLLTGELAPSEGEVEIEFLDRNDQRIWVNLWTARAHAAWRSFIAVAPSEPFISSDTIGGNLALGQEIDEESAMAAARFAELATDLAHFRQGLAEEIGESGVNLSGGQRQRVSLARAIYSGRTYRLLDDPLSALDAHTEHALMERFRKDPHGYFLITHRMGELAGVAEVCVLADGQIRERGEPARLAADPTSRLATVLRAYSDKESEVLDE